MKGIDSLTGFLDRSGCLRTATQLVRDLAASGQPLAVLWFNLDRFKQVNESFGHIGGDSVIADIAIRFRARTSGRAELSRMGGDEFVCLVPECDRIQAQQLARELMNTVEEPLTVGDLVLHPTASVGIAIYETGEDPLELLERADRAMFASKGKGGNSIVISGDEPVPGRLGILLAREELSIENSLHTAFETGGFHLHYQPILRADGSIEAVEALMRCTVNNQTISPGKFIPVAEKTGLITRLGEWSLLQGALQARTLRDAGCPTKVAINISRAQLVSPKFSNALHAALLCANIQPDLIELELTESLFMDISETVQKNLKSAIKAGISLAIDDFGTGYSCLANLKDIPARKLKLDRTFVTVLPDDSRALAVVQAVTQLGRNLGMTVVAEGCETQKQNDALLNVGVDAIQGYLHAYPMPGEDLIAWIQERKQP
ncbi:MAG: EAL domain-containing protein [Sideroxydans sp.]|nr:EAL domain-containing protein [Sideroxydans sp.]